MERRSARLAAKRQPQVTPSTGSLTPLTSLSPTPPSSPPPELATPSSDPKWARLDALLSADEVKVLPGVWASASRNTRPSNWYERHLGRSYQLCAIKVLNNLPTALISFAKRTFDDLRSKGHPPPTESFLTLLALLYESAAEYRRAEADASVVEFYMARTRCWCILGSMEHLRTGDWGAPNPVIWSRTPSEHTLAITDGVLRVRQLEDCDNLPNAIGDTVCANWQLLRDKSIKFTLANWEFKSLFVESDHCITDIVHNIALNGSFQWGTCPGSQQQCLNHSRDAASDTHVGQDAMWSSTATWLGDECSSELPDRDLLPNLVEPVSPPDRHGGEAVAHSMIQQLCGQAVTTDNTFMCLSSGNKEFIGIRHRRTQTLYLSPQIDRVSMEAYGWLQAGLYLAIVKDAVARFSLQNSSSGDSSDDDETGPKGHHQKPSSTHPDHDWQEGRSGKSGSRGTMDNHSEMEDSGGSTNVDISTLNAVLNMISTACVRLQYGFFNSVHPSQFTRYSHPLSTKQLHALVTLKDEIARGATGHVHGGTLQVEDGRTCISLPIVMKIAFGPDEIRQLEHEDHIYCVLREAHIQVSTVYGLFREHRKDGGSDATGLILSYGGTSLEKSPQVTAEQSKSFLATLKAIHGIGILHGDIHPQNLINDAGETTIIDFAYSVKNTPQHKLDAELKQLSDLLLQLESTSS